MPKPDSSAIQDLRAIASQCVMCGLCLPHCPTYAVTRLESESPRGRLALLANEASAWPDSDTNTLDHCLTCGRCERVCPAHVRVVDAIVAARRIHPSRTHWIGALARRLIRHPTARSLAIAATTRLRNVLPPTLRRRVNADGIAALADPTARHAPRVAASTLTVLAGCGSDAYEQRAIAALRRIAEALDLSLRIDTDHCCGALATHLGIPDDDEIPERDTATRYLTLTTGCASQWRQRLGSERTVGIASWLWSQWSSIAPKLKQRAARVSLHAPCTLAPNDAEWTATLRIVGSLPGASRLPDPEHAGCCGAAGIYAMNQPTLSDQLRDRLTDALIDAPSDWIVSGNGACRAQIAQGLHDRQHVMRVAHLAELVAAWLDPPP